MSIQLRDYQEDAVNRMKNGCILAGGVGSGETIKKGGDLSERRKMERY